MSSVAMSLGSTFRLDSLMEVERKENLEIRF